MTKTFVRGKQILTPQKTRPKTKLTDKQEKFADLIARGYDQYEAYGIAYERDIASMKRSNLVSYVNRTVKSAAVADRIEQLKHEYEIRAKFGDIPVDKLMDVKATRTRISKYEEEWNSKIAFDKLNGLLKGAEQTLILLSERPKLFQEVNEALTDVNLKLTSLGYYANKTDMTETNKHLKDIVESISQIQTVIHKVGTFNVKEYNSTIATVQSLTKTINDLTGVSKNPEKIKSEQFEDRLLGLIEYVAETSGADGFEKHLADFAFD